MPAVYLIPVVTGIAGYIFGVTSDTKKLLVYGSVAVGGYYFYKASKK